MTTGDVKNNLRKLLAQLKGIQYPNHVDWDGLTAGLSTAFLPIMHHLFLDYSQELASYLSNRNYELFAKSDLKFVELVYKILIQDFSYKPSLTKDKFFSPGFAERKIIFLTDMIKRCREKHDELALPKKSKLSVKSKTRGQGTISKLQPRKQLPPAIPENVSLQADETVFRAMKSDIQFTVSHSVPDDREITNTTGKIETNIVPHIPPVPSELPQVADVPKPSPLLMLTPMKDVEGAELSQVTDDGSDALIEEVGHDLPTAVNVRIERHENRSTTSYLGDQESGLKGHDEAGSSILDQNDTQIGVKRCFMKPTDYSEHNSKRYTVCSGCNKLQGTLEIVLREFKELSATFEEVKSVNNELAARVLLLETKSRMLEGQLDSIPSQRNDHDEVPEVVSIEGFKARQAMSDKVKIIDRNYIEAARDRAPTEHRPNEGKNYSPVKYMDEMSSVPPDFKPLNINDLTPRNFINGTEGVCVDHRYPTSDIVNEEIEMNKEVALIESVSSDSIHSDGIAGFSHDCFDTPLRNVVANVEKKLLETTNILKQSSVYVSSGSYR